MDYKLIGASSEVTEMFDILYGHIIMLNIRWIMFYKLFRETDSTVNTLNDVASSFFYHIKQLIFDYMFLAISRVTDKKKFDKYTPASLYTLLDFIESSNEPHLSDNLRVILKNVEDSNIRYHRDKRIAHLDFEYETDLDDKSSYKVIIKDIDDAVDAINNFMNTITMHYNNAEIGFEHTSFVSNVDALVFFLQDSTVLRKKLYEIYLEHVK